MIEKIPESENKPMLRQDVKTVHMYEDDLKKHTATLD